MEIKNKIWIEKDGQLLLGYGCIKLLRTVYKKTLMSVAVKFTRYVL